VARRRSTDGPTGEDAPAGLPDPPLAAWERDVGVRRAARLVLAMEIDAQSNVPAEETARRLAPGLRALTMAQRGIVARALADARRMLPEG
jgi:hypothetical protein